MPEILILCVGNSCRSQMAEGFLKSFAPSWQVFSAGTDPAKRIHPKAVQVMSEAGVDISGQYPKTVDQFLEQNFDHVITVCDNALETCPVFHGKVKWKHHFPFADPDKAKGSPEEILSQFRKIRDEIKTGFFSFCEEIKKGVTTQV